MEKPAGGAKSRVLLAASLVLAAGGGGAVASVAPAQAATIRVAYDAGPVGHLGSYTEGGSVVFCIDQGPDYPTRAISGRLVSSLSQQSGGPVPQSALLKVNAAIDNFYEEIADRRWAAAMQLYVWRTIDADKWNDVTNGVGADWYKRRVTEGGGSEAEWQQVLANLNTITAYANTVKPVTAGTVTANLSFSTSTEGTYSITVPTGGSGTATVTNGVFEDTGQKTRPVSAGAHTFKVAGQPTVGDGGNASDGKYSVTVAFAGTGPSGYEQNVVLYDPADGQQRLVTRGKQSPGTLSASDSASPSIAFSPTATSVMKSKFLKVGDPVIDVITSGLAEGSLPWFSGADGAGVPVEYSITYYNSATPIVEAEDVPESGKVIGTDKLTFTGADQVKETSGNVKAPTNGYVTAVITTSTAGQPAAEAKDALSPGYTWHDNYGIAAETLFIAPDVTTKATPRVKWNGSAEDTAHIPFDVPEGSYVYFQLFEGDTCTPETLVWTSKNVPVMKAGDYKSGKYTFSEKNKVGDHWWIEFLATPGADGKPLELDRGACKTAGEGTYHEAKPKTGSLAATGADLDQSSPIAMAGGAGLLLIGLVAMAGAAASKRRRAVEEVAAE